MAIVTRFLDSTLKAFKAMMGKTALILGATGATGKFLLQELLASPSYTLIGEYGRRITPTDQLAVGKDKLQQRVIDFEKLDEAKLNELRWEVVFICLGSKVSGMSAAAVAAFEKVDREYVVNAAKAARIHDASIPQRLIYISAASADAQSRRLYSRSKGLTELALAAIGYEEMIVFRPGGLTDGQRQETRFGEAIAHSIINLNTSWSDRLLIKVPILAKVMRNAGTLGYEVIRQRSSEGSSLPFIMIGNTAIPSLTEA